jgi:alanine dehydrogenase
MLMVGAGTLASYLIRAHASVRPIREVSIWNRSRAHAEALARTLQASEPRLSITVADDLETAVRAADLVSCATISKTPLIKGDWLTPGCHLDLVGAFRPDMREADDTCVRRAKIWVDTRAGGLHEAGDIVIPLATKVICEADVLGDLFDLTRNPAPQRSANDITLFKSVGASIEDLAAAVAVFEATTT